MGRIGNALSSIAGVTVGVGVVGFAAYWWMNRGDPDNPGPRKSLAGLLFGGGLGGDGLLKSGSGGTSETDARGGSAGSSPTPSDGGGTEKPQKPGGGGGGADGGSGSSGGSGAGGLGGSGSGGGLGDGQGSQTDGQNGDGTDGDDNDGGGGDGDGGGGESDDPEGDVAENIGQYGDALIEIDLPPPQQTEQQQKEIVNFLTKLVMEDILSSSLPPPYAQYDPDGGSKLAYWADLAFFTAFPHVPFGRLNPYNESHHIYIKIWQGYLKFAYLAEQSKAESKASANDWLTTLLVG